MNPMDMLQRARSMGYGNKPDSEGETGKRSFPLTPEEVQALGENVDCVKCYGAHDGKTFSITRVEPDKVQSGDEGEEVRVKMPTQMSPS